MPESVPVDIFASKGAEYLLVIFFLGALVLYLRFLLRPAPSRAVPAPAAQPAGLQDRWFHVPEEMYYHPGHSWVQPNGGEEVTIGISDFAQKLIGRPDGVRFPEVGTQLEHGVPGLVLKVGEESIELLSPVDGEVIAVNQAVLDDPELVNRDPYGTGWLVKVKTSRWSPNQKCLLRDRMANAWMEITERVLRQEMAGKLGTVLQDGGFPVTGIARSISDEEWSSLVKEFFLTE